MQIKGLLCG